MIHELEDFLHNGIQDLTVYHSQIKFREPTHTDLKINGVSAYLMLWRFVRFSLITYYTDPILIVTSLKQIPLTRSQKDSQDSGGDESSTLSPGNEGEKDGNGDDDGSGGVIKEPPDQEPHNNTPTNNKNDKDNNIKEIMLSVRWIFEGKPLLSSEISQFEGHFRYGFDPKTGLINYHEFVGIYPNPTASFLARFSWPSSSSGSSPSSPSV
ncbi:hypothetical protein H4219_005138 [Mycoemilia scoparia]|uniref:Uncharacterized protein n=1 Tax=Mycoemilia scoparia TaxID=417184 RepID=A0A9W8DQM8_9FUNG|nr:hypothetical protein H4219_005138 [Mycoemilia scoparia]